MKITIGDYVIIVYNKKVRYSLDHNNEEEYHMNGQSRKDIYVGATVYIILKADQRTGKLTRGIVKDILTKSQIHTRGIKVRLTDGQIGRVQEVIN